MKILLLILVGWLALSIPISLLIARVLRLSARAEHLPRTEDEKDRRQREAA